MALEHLFGIAGSALNAQTARMNAAASNLANAGSSAGSDKDAYRAKRLEFKTILEKHTNAGNNDLAGGVMVNRVADSTKPIARMSDPGNPSADKDGFVYLSNVNEMTEMVEMMASARSYQNNVEVVNTARALMLKTLEMIKS